MSFNKRLVSTEIIISTIDNNKPLEDLFKSDAIIFLDEFSTKIFNMLDSGVSKQEIFKLIEDEKRRQN